MKSASFVFAESATALFRDSGYNDLIEFEADIAQISETVLLVAESAGSLTELGAFAIHPQISPRLQVFMQADHHGDESFIRLGPIRRLEHLHDAVSFYPWRTFSDGRINVSSVRSLVRDIRRDINEKLKSQKSEVLDTDNRRHIMILMFWLIYVLRGAAERDIVDGLKLFGITLTPAHAKRYLYCLRVCGWILEIPYQRTTWYIHKADRDPLKYSFNTTATTKHSLRWKSDIAESLKSAPHKRPKAVRDAIRKQLS